MPCPSCQAARETDSQSTQYNSLHCVYCAARLLKSVDKLQRLSAQDKPAKKREMLAESVAAGLSELEIRRLYKDGPWIEPLPDKPVKRVRG